MAAAPGGPGFSGVGGSPKGSADSWKGSAEAPPGSAEAPQGSAETPLGSAAAPLGSAEAPQGSGAAPQGSGAAPQGRKCLLQVDYPVAIRLPAAPRAIFQDDIIMGQSRNRTAARAKGRCPIAKG